MDDGHKCSQCGAPLAPADPPRPPCPKCGGEGRSFVPAVNDEAKASDSVTRAVSYGRTVGDHISTSDSVSYRAESANAATARRLRLEQAVDDIEAAVDRNVVSDAQSATKRALEEVHELADCLKRGEWSQDGWDADAEGEWRAHIGARNAAHHTSSPVVALHSGTAAAVCALLADAEPGRFDRAACRWLARYCVETPDVTLEAIDEALGALQAMGERPADSLVTLRELVSNHP